MAELDWPSLAFITCCQGGAAQHVATQLEAKLRDHLKARNNLFNEAAGGLASSLYRPLLCLFDRNFELSVVLQVGLAACFVRELASPFPLHTKRMTLELSSSQTPHTNSPRLCSLSVCLNPAGCSLTCLPMCSLARALT